MMQELTIDGALGVPIPTRMPASMSKPSVSPTHTPILAAFFNQFSLSFPVSNPAPTTVPTGTSAPAPIPTVTPEPLSVRYALPEARVMGVSGRLSMTVYTPRHQLRPRNPPGGA